MKPLYERDRIEAAKVIGRHKGHAGRIGGWIYTEAGRPIVHGWHAYAILHRSAIKAKKVTDPKTGKTVTRYAIDWRRVG